MNKRTMIFSPILKDQEEIGMTLEDYFNHNFKGHLPIDIQKFATLHEPTMKGYSLGNGGEILIVFDRRLCPREGSYIEHQGRRNEINLEELAIKDLRMQKGYCYQQGIPFLTYEGEIERRVEREFIAKLDKVKEGISKRLI
jgi:hypothetical protein